jgi:tRNA (adenine37-N6)-methyltransferase
MSKEKMEISQSITFSFTPVGWICSPFKEKFGAPRQGVLVPSSQGWIEIKKSWIEKGALEGLDSFSHLWVTSVFHQNLDAGSDHQKSGTAETGKVRPPRLQGKKIGVFASRSPFRPNPLGLSLMKLERIECNRVYVSGLDLVDGTPVLDIKPYLPEVDHASDAKGGWLEQVSLQKRPVVFSEEAERALQAIEKSASIKSSIKSLMNSPEVSLRSLIVEILQLDPRPVSQRKQKKSYGITLFNWNVRFIEKGSAFEVVSLEE